MDAFADLVWDSSKTNSAKNATLGAQQKAQTPLQPSSSSSSIDSFGRLAAAVQPLSTGMKPVAQPRPIGVGAVGVGIGGGPRAGSSGPNGDPFSGLFARGGSPNINMSMADRRAHAEREKRERERREREKLDAQGAMWDQLEGHLSANASNSGSRAVSPSPALFGVNANAGTGNLPSSRSHAAATPPLGLKTNPGIKVPSSQSASTDLFWSMHQSPPSGTSRATSPLRASPVIRQSTPTIDALLSSKPTPIRSHSNDAWSQLDALVAPKPAPAPSSRPAAAALDPFDMDFLSDPSPVSHQPTPPRSRARTPGDFDFNEREELNASPSDEDDILGDLAKPVSDLNVQSPPRTSSQPNRNGTRPVSPPPHILGKIVEMGFTPQQARLALAATDSGVDVEAALESLLAAGGDVTSPTSFEQDQYSDRDASNTRAVPSRAPPRARDVNEAAAPRTAGTSTPPTRTNTGTLQAEDLLAQASKFGFSMLTKASVVWNQSREVVQKAYEENVKPTLATPSTSRGAGEGVAPRPNDGRPKWMTVEVPELADDVKREPTSRVDRFVDDMDGGPSPLDERPPRRREEAPISAVSAKKPLFEDEDTGYVSPHRRRPGPDTRNEPAAPRAAPIRQTSVPSTRNTPSSSRPSAAAVARLPKMAIPETSPAAIASSISSRTKGTEFFKLGQYADAESAYTSGITALPPTHPLLTSLYTNRAAARLKTGDMGGAVGDCTQVFKLSGIGENLGGLLHLEEDMTFRFDGVPGKLDVREQLVKALQRRAAGLEGMERWDKARGDWERLSGLNWGQAQGRIKEDATRSAARCRGMVKAATAPQQDLSSTSSPAPSKPRPRPRPSKPAPPSEASHRLKQQEAAQEAEANEQIQLKDSVDARILAWKGGKETNIRALIASLETVLWPELGWVKVGMHELVTPSQVKIRYTKAIAKVHPDKLKTGNTTVEQKMLANGVFGGLNEAWGAFKQ